MKKTKKAQFEKWADGELLRYRKILLQEDKHLYSITPSGDESKSYSYTRFPYKDIKIEYGEAVYDMWKSGKKSEASRILLHEMIHPIVDPIMKYATDRFVTRETLVDQMEQLTDHFTNVIDKLLSK